MSAMVRMFEEVGAFVSHVQVQGVQVSGASAIEVLLVPTAAMCCAGCCVLIGPNKGLGCCSWKSTI